MNAGLREELASATDPLQISAIQEKIMYVNGARALLLLLFISICMLVYKAHRNKQKEQIK